MPVDATIPQLIGPLPVKVAFETVAGALVRRLFLELGDPRRSW